MSVVSFIESTIGLSLEDRDRVYLSEREGFYAKRNKASSSSLYALGRQCAHIAMLPYKVCSLAVQTIMDIALLIISLVAAPLVLAFGRSSKAVEKEISIRCYNILVADAFSWLSLIPSLFSSHFYYQADLCHLGTLRSVY